MRIKDLPANLIQLTFSPGAFQEKPLININIHAFRDRCEILVRHGISADALHPGNQSDPLPMLTLVTHI